jgi:deazaflavin-dependent oxidoreductase (nitroreductase family)
VSANDYPNNAPGFPSVFPAWFDRFQIKYFDPVLKPIAPYMPGIATVKHCGRTSGKPYQTIVSTYRKGNVLAISLVHGKTDWAKNVLAARGADIQFGPRREVHITNPRMLPAGSDGPEVQALPFMARVQLRRVGVLVADIA